MAKNQLQLFLSQVPAGFPSPATDFLEKKLDLDELLIKNPASTFFVRVTGDSMKDSGIHSGDILVVDRSLEPKSNDIAVCILNGEFTVKRIKKQGDKFFLISSNKNFQPIEVSSESDFSVWGIPTFSIHQLR
jgi:DNA polymerase V